MLVLLVRNKWKFYFGMRKVLKKFCAKNISKRKGLIEKWKYLNDNDLGKSSPLLGWLWLRRCYCRCQERVLIAVCACRSIMHSVSSCLGTVHAALIPPLHASFASTLRTAVLLPHREEQWRMIVADFMAHWFFDGSLTLPNMRHHHTFNVNLPLL